jgi:RNA polymerase sigma-70 factor (ECF subfamily)
VRDETTTRTDAELLRRSRSDPDGFGDLAERYVLRLDSWFRKRTGDPAVAADLTSETLAQAWQSAPRFRDLAEGSAAPWLYGIAQNLLRSYARKRRVETAARRRLGMPLRDYAGLEEADERLAAGAHASLLQEAMDDLPAREREALELRVIEDLPYDDVADRLGVSQGVARTYVSRALRSLRTRFQGVKP